MNSEILNYVLFFVCLVSCYKWGYYKASIDAKVETQKQLDRIDAVNNQTIKNLTEKYKIIVNQVLEASENLKQENEALIVKSKNMLN